MPNITLQLKPLDGGAELTLTTNDQDVVASKSIESGRYKILQKDGRPAYYYVKLDVRDGSKPGAPFGQLLPAEFTTQTEVDTIISVVVGAALSAPAQQELQLRADTYYRNKTRVKTAGRGQETEGETRRSFETSADNLLLAAGWSDRAGTTLHWSYLMTSVLPGFLDTYYPSVAAQEFYLVVLEEDARRFRVWNSAGARELDLELDPSKDINGLFGLYAVFQNEDGPYFMDLASRTSSVGIVNRATDLSLEGLLLDPAPYVDYYNRNSAKFELVCLAPTSGVLDTIALQGGTGRLEDYGSNESLNVKIHSRNVAVCKNMRDAYESYVRGYIKRVQATSNEGELRALGPPLAFHEMSAPVGWTKDRVVDLFNAQFTNDELDAWKAIAQAIDGFNWTKIGRVPLLSI